MRVALVHPAGYNFCPGQPDLTLFANRMAPIGILTLASWLDKHGHETMLLDCLGPRAPKNAQETAQNGARLEAGHGGVLHHHLGVPRRL